MTAKATPDNLKIWNALAKTDPAHTKPFSRAGGFKGTALKPMWIIKMLTEQFGAAGIGWGVGKPEFQMVHGDGEVLVYCTVPCWHTTPDNVLYGVGGDKVLTMRRDGKAFHDDEAFKKAFTDAINNAFKSIGVGADIHMGQFDDSKYLAEVAAEFATRDESKVAMATDDQLGIIDALVKAAHVSTQTILDSVNAKRPDDAKVKGFAELTEATAASVIKKLNKTIADNAAKAAAAKPAEDILDDDVPY